MIMVETRPDTLKIDGDFLTFEAKEKHTNEKLLVSYRLKNVSEKDFFSHLSSSMQIKGTFTTQDVEGARNLNGFDYKRYLAFKGISQKVTLENIDQIKKVKFSILHPVRVLQEFRRKQIVYNNERFSPLTADYMNSLLFGYRENSVESFQSTWQSLGVSHLFSLSGMHIYFFLSLFEFLFLNIRLTQEKLFKWSIPFTIILIIMTGCGPGMMRAGIQTITKKVNKQFKIQLTPIDCWSLTLLLNVFIDPFVLLTVGGQLTYYLTFLIVFIYPITACIKDNFRKGVVFSLLLSWLSLPLIWYHFNEFNVLNFMLNIILTPILFVIILPLLLGTFILSHIVGSLSFFWLDYMLTQFQLVGENLNKWRSFQQVTGKIPVCLLLLVIVVQLSFLKELELRPKVISKKMIFLLILSCLVPFWKFLNPVGTVAFVDVGQGDSLFVQLPFHKGNYLVDTGGQLNFQKEEWQEKTDSRGGDYTLIPYMKSKGVKKLDGVFITHAHEDHFGDLDRISDSIQVNHILFDEGTSVQPNFSRMLGYENLKSSHKHIIKKGDSFKKKDAFLECLYPMEKGNGQNDDSLVLKLYIKDQIFLLMGDLEADGENELMKDPKVDLNATILKVGHHGSQTSSQMNFLERVKPEVSVISCGQNNRYGHPSPETIDKLTYLKSDVYQTNNDGMTYLTWNPFSNSVSQIKTVKK